MCPAFWACRDSARVPPTEVAEKSIGPETGVQRLTAEGEPALWIEGAAHTFTLLDADGSPIEETTRLAAQCAPEANGVNHRLETTGDLQNSLAIVDKLEPRPGADERRPRSLG
jgi:hypothetical protein